MSHAKTIEDLLDEVVEPFTHLKLLFIVLDHSEYLSYLMLIWLDSFFGNDNPSKDYLESKRFMLQWERSEDLVYCKPVPVNCPTFFEFYAISRQCFYLERVNKIYSSLDHALLVSQFIAYVLNNVPHLLDVVTIYRNRPFC